MPRMRSIEFVKEHIIYRFGIPHTITTNQGSIFVTDEFFRFADSMGIKLLNFFSLLCTSQWVR